MCVPLEDAPRCFERLAVHGQRLYAESFRRIFIWDTARGELLSFHDTEAPLDSATLAISADGRRFATAHGKRGMALWDADSFARLRVFAGHSEEVATIRFVSADDLVSCSGDGSLRRWNATSGEEIGCFETSPLYSLALHPKEKLIAAGGSLGGKGLVVILDVDSLQLTEQIELDVSTQPFPPISERGRRSAGITAERRDKALVSCLAWHLDGRHLLAGSWDRTLKLVERNASRLSREWAGHSHWVSAIAMTQSGHILTSGGSDGKLIGWSLDAPDPVLMLELGAPIGDMCLAGGRLYAAVEGDIQIFSLPRELREA